MHGPMRGWRVRIALALSLLLAACNNSPYPDGAAATNTIFNSFDERSPRYLDPTASYSNPETPYTYSAYEPMYAYHYLKRPYELIPKTAEAVAKPHYVDKAGQPLPDDAPPEQIAESIYDVHLKKGILYAPHPAFAKNDKGEYLYHHLTREQVGDKRSTWDFEKRARASWWPRTTSTPSSATPPRASRRRSTPSSRSTCSG